METIADACSPAPATPGSAWWRATCADARRGGRPGGRSGRRGCGRSAARALPRGRPARQRARVRLLAGGGGARRARWWSGPTRPTAATSWPGTSPTPSASSWSPTRPTCPWSTGSHLGAALGDGRGRQRPGAAWSTIPAGGASARRLRGGAARRRRRPVGDAETPRLPDLHLGHLRRAQGVPVHPGPAGPHRRHRGPDVRAHRRRRLLPVHAPLPLQRPDGRMGSGAGGRRHRGPAPGGRFSASGFLPDVRRHGVTYFNYVGQAAVLHPGHPRAARRRRQPPGAGLRQRRGRADDVARFAERFGCTVDRRLRLDRGRGHGAAHPRHAPGRARAGTRGHRRPRPGHRPGVPAGPLRRRRASAQRRGGHR